MNRLARIGSGFVTLLQPPEKPKETPAFVGRRRRKGAVVTLATKTAEVQKKKEVEKPPAFQPTWRFKTDPEHLFRISIMGETQQPFTPPPTTTAAWGEEEGTPPPPCDAAEWGEIEDEPDLEPNVAPSDEEEGEEEDPPPLTPTDPPPPIASENVPWDIRLYSPRPASEADVCQIVPWVVRPTSPVMGL